MSHITYTFKIILEREEDAKLFDNEQVFLDEYRLKSSWFDRKICLFNEPFEPENFNPKGFIRSVKNVVLNATVYFNAESASSGGGEIWVSESGTNSIDFYEDYEGMVVFSTVGSNEWLQGLEELKNLSFEEWDEEEYEEDECEEENL